MKKAITMLLGLALISAISMAMISPAHATIQQFTWLPPYIMKGYQGAPYYDYVVIYESGSTVNLLVPVTNDVYSLGLNVSKVILNFYDMGRNKTLDYSTSPHKVTYGNTELFTVSFVADATEAGDNTWAHVYRIYVEHVNATTGPTKIVGTWTSYYNSFFPAYRFVVWSTSQADAMISLSKYNAYYSTYGIGYWDSVLGGQKAHQAIMEKNLGDQYLTSDYASALTQYDKANTLWEEALAAENEYRTRWDNADLNETLTNNAVNMAEANAFKIDADAHMIEANAAQTMADAALTNAYGWYFIGIGFALGWTLMGVGAIIWAWRRPKPPA
jgi:hypothetical protein